MSSRSLTLYQVTFADVNGVDVSLGNIDGHGTTVTQHIVDILQSDLFPYVDKKWERALKVVDWKEHDPGVLTVRAHYGHFGVDFSVAPIDDLSAVVDEYSETDTNLVELAAVLMIKPARKRGWLATLSIGSHSMATSFNHTLRRGSLDVVGSGGLHIDPASRSDTFQTTLDNSRLRTVAFRVDPAQLGEDDLPAELPLTEIGEVQLVVKPHRGKWFSREAATAIKRKTEDGDIVVLRSPNRGMQSEKTTLEVELEGGKRRKLNIVAGEESTVIPRFDVGAPPAGVVLHDWINLEAARLIADLDSTWR